MEPTLSSFDQRIKDSVDAHSAEAERKSMIREVQSLVKRLHALEVDDIDLKDSASRAAESLDRVVGQMEAIALATNPPIEFEWDRNYLFEVVSGVCVISSVTVNPFCDTRLSKSEWADVKRKEYLLQAIARKKFGESISIEPA